jgi:hypothetical protein
MAVLAMQQIKDGYTAHRSAFRGDAVGIEITLGGTQDLNNP